MSINKPIVLGSDPEIFIESESGILIPAFTFLPSKYEPLKTNEEGMNYYWDGFQTEFNVKPSSNLFDCLASIRYGLKALLTAAQQKDPTARLATKTVVEVSPDKLALLPAEFTDFGCAPSFNIYGISGMMSEGHTVPYRFSGGHIHFGIGKQPYEMLEVIVSALDSVLGVACVSLFEHIDNPVRRQYYGLVGEYRTPPHGLEYRVLSNAWLFDPHLAINILDLARKVTASVLDGTLVWKTQINEVIETVLTSNANKAREILDRNKETLKAFNPSIDYMTPVSNNQNISKNWSI